MIDCQTGVIFAKYNDHDIKNHIAKYQKDNSYQLDDRGDVEFKHVRHS